MKPSDYFVQKLREDTQLRSSLIAWLEEQRAVFAQRIVTFNAHDEILRAQGSCRGLDNLIAIVKNRSIGQNNHGRRDEDRNDNSAVLYSPRIADD